MKKIFASLLALTLCTTIFGQAPVPAAKESAAGKPAEAKAVESNDWDFIYIAFFPNVPSSANESRVYGVKVGAPISFGEKSFVSGVEISAFASINGEMNGFQASPVFNSAKELKGLQFSIVNLVEKAWGLQLGLVNCAKSGSFQIGLINYIEDSPIPVLPIINCRF